MNTDERRYELNLLTGVSARARRVFGDPGEHGKNAFVNGFKRQVAHMMPNQSLVEISPTPRAIFYRKPVLTALLGLIFLSFFGTLTASAWMFPQNYDWRYRVISNLLSPRDNPDHYWLPACGLAVAGVLMLPFTGYLRRNLEIVSPRAARMSAGAFMVGIIALICTCFVVPQHLHDVLGVRRLHEFLARCAAAFMAIGMLSGCWGAWRGRGPRLFGTRLFCTWSIVTLLPLAGIFCSEFLLLLTQLKPSWAMPIRSALRHSVFWHLGFWEWSGAVAVFVFLCAAVFLTPWQVTERQL